MQEGDPQSRTAFLYLSLMLLVLAFFIVLFSMSSPDAKKSAKVIGSVATTFVPAPAREPGPAWPGAGTEIGPGRGGLERALRALVAEELALIELGPVSPGRIEIRMPLDVLFYRGEARVRGARSALLDRIVAAVTLGPSGRRVEVGAILGVGGSAGEPLPSIPSSLPIARAAALGDALIGRGLPRSRLVLGLDPGRKEGVVLAFTIGAVDGDEEKGADEGDEKGRADKPTARPSAAGVGEETGETT